MANNYWSHILAARISRRRALAATAGASAAAAILAACGGDDDDEGTAGDVSGLLTPVKVDSNTKRGGTLKHSIFFEPRNFDPQNFPNNFLSRETFSLLFGMEYGIGEFPSSATITPNVAESWELSGDKTTLTVKMSPEAHFAPVAPVNGRTVDAHDVVASWKRMEAVSNQAADFANSKSKSAPIVSMEAPDAKTVTIKLNQPNASIQALLARDTPGSFYIIPKEAADDKVLDITRTPIGSGFMYVEKFTPSVGITLKRNPAFKNFKGDLPYLDGIELPLITETATGLSQFIAGNLHTYTVPAEEIVATKRRVPDLEMKQTEFQTSTLRIAFGTGQDSPFVDQRVRQAWMLALDRDLYTDVQYNVSKFESDGVPVQIALESGLQANSLKGWFLNAATEPEKFGENAKFFKKDLAEAKKLLAAGGFPDGVETPLTWVQRSAAWSSGHWYNGVDIVVGMLQESGLFRVQQKILQNFFPDYIVPYHHQVPGVNYAGAAFSISNLPTDPAIYLYQYYNSAGGLRQSTDSTLDGLTSRAIAEFDEKKRRELVHEIQVYEAGANLFPRMGAATGFALSWPALRNWQVYQGGSGLAGSGGSTDARVFLDPEKAPLKGN